MWSGGRAASAERAHGTYRSRRRRSTSRTVSAATPMQVPTIAVESHQPMLLEKWPDLTIDHNAEVDIGGTLQARFVAGDPPDFVNNSGDGQMDLGQLATDGRGHLGEGQLDHASTVRALRPCSSTSRRLTAGCCSAPSAPRVTSPNVLRPSCRAGASGAVAAGAGAGRPGFVSSLLTPVRTWSPT